jgi:hypothetical protein
MPALYLSCALYLSALSLSGQDKGPGQVRASTGQVPWSLPQVLATPWGIFAAWLFNDWFAEGL